MLHGQARNKSISAPTATSRGAPKGCVIAFVGIFVAFGVGMLAFAFIPAVANVVRARTWVETPCTVISSGLDASHGSRSTTYKVLVQYRYVYQGHTYESDRYWFMGGSSNVGVDAKREAIARMKPGSHLTCYVNPNRPAEAVINRSLTPEIWFGAIPLLFAIVGTVVIVVMLKPAKPKASIPSPLSRGGRAVLAKDWVPVDKGHVTSAHGAGVIELRPSSTPLGRFIGLSIFCLVWNGFLIAIGWAAFDGGSSRDACLFAFLSVFAIIGVIVLVAVVKQFLALFNPRPTVTISPSDIRAGTRVEVSWSNQGRYDRITKLSIELEGKEEAKYRRGTKTTTDRSVFARVPLVETTKQIDIARGKRTVTIPDGAIHSLDLSNNKVIWLLKVTGEIANWPDVSEEMPLTVGAAETRSPMDFGGAAQEVTSSDGTLTLSVAGKEFTPGAEVKGWFAWEPAEKREWIEARLFYYTSGKGTRDVRVVQQTRIDSPDERGRREFSFRLPEGPFSFSGTLISLLWAVELVDHKGRKDEETVMAELVVSPTGEEIVFHSLEEKKP